MTFLSNSYVINRDTVIIMNEYEICHIYLQYVYEMAIQKEQCKTNYIIETISFETIL